MPSVKSVISVILIGLVVSSAAFTAPKSKKKSKTESEVQQPVPEKADPKAISVTVHDCCPRETAALAVQIELKATAEGIYTGTETIAVSEKNHSELAQYAAACTRIAKALTRSRGTEICASFNTKPDGSGLSLKLTTKDEIKETVRILSEMEEKIEIFAFYEKPGVPETSEEKDTVRIPEDT